VISGSTIDAPEEPTRANYIFIGWFTDNGTFAKRWDFATQTVTADITLYGKWVLIFTVTFDSNGGSAVEPETVTEGSMATRPALPIKFDFGFAGWYTDNTTFADKWDFATRKVASDITLYAKWVDFYEIVGVRWAEYNVNAFRTFATNPEDSGMFYQWNRSTAWPATGDVVGWDATNATGDSWESANDPCPAGWRLPTQEEQATLLDTDNVINEWTSLNSVNGHRFTDKVSGASIFFPAAGSRSGIDGTHYNVSINGFYWSSSQLSAIAAFSLNFTNGTISRGHYRYSGFSVRCVRQ